MITLEEIRRHCKGDKVINRNIDSDKLYQLLMTCRRNEFSEYAFFGTNTDNYLITGDIETIAPYRSFKHLMILEEIENGVSKQNALLTNDTEFFMTILNDFLELEVE